MKKIIFILLSSLCLILTACSNTTPKKEEKSNLEFIDNIQLEKNNINDIDNNPEIIEKGRD